MRDLLAVSTKPSGKGFIDLEGRRFGRLVVLGYAGPFPPEATATTPWWCRCDCGAITRPSGQKLKRRFTVSCGCWRQEQIFERAKNSRGVTKLRAYKSYSHMIDRCLNAKCRAFGDYGGRGIFVCKRWLEGDGALSGFECFLADLGERPLGRSLDRIDNDGDYEPGNCRWATPLQQSRNRRRRRR